VTTDMSPTGGLLVTLIFLRGSVLLSLLRDFRVLRWHGTSQGAARPLGQRYFDFDLALVKGALRDIAARPCLQSEKRFDKIHMLIQRFYICKVAHTYNI
jgi:hypothetical protein